MSKQWWHNAVVYQIYPRSFMDANGDGCGDLAGITQRLDYLAGLGVDAVWISPFFTSPMVDNGYDISDYRGIDPRFGTLEDFDALVARANQLNIKILLDLVLNHSSDQHPWFKAALADPASHYRDYYIFKKPAANGGPPNNWRSIFGGSAWQLDDASGEYYLHVFAKEQPDLNWENPRLRQELYDVVDWWLDRGVSGFRMDAITYIKKDPSYPSLPPDGPDGLADLSPGTQTRPGIGAFLTEMRDTVFGPRNVFTVAEATGVPPQQLADFIGDDGYFTTIFDFNYCDIDIQPGGIWHARSGHTVGQLRQAVYESQQASLAVGQCAIMLENHDLPRALERYLPAGLHTDAAAKALGTVSMFLRGIPFLYQGQELGARNFPWENMDQFDDVSTKDQYQRALDAGHSSRRAFELVCLRSRDNARVPMLWHDGPGGGFTTGRPWLPLHPDAPARNVKNQEQDPTSVLNYYKKLLALHRGEYCALFYSGGFEACPHKDEGVFAYLRTAGGTTILVVANISLQQAEGVFPQGKVLLGTHRQTGMRTGNTLALCPMEAVVLRCE